MASRMTVCVCLREKVYLVWSYVLLILFTFLTFTYIHVIYTIECRHTCIKYLKVVEFSFDQMLRRCIGFAWSFLGSGKSCEEVKVVLVSLSPHEKFTWCGYFHWKTRRVFVRVLFYRIDTTVFLNDVVPHNVKAFTRPETLRARTQCHRYSSPARMVKTSN